MFLLQLIYWPRSYTLNINRCFLSKKLITPAMSHRPHLQRRSVYGCLVQHFVEKSTEGLYRTISNNTWDRVSNREDNTFTNLPALGWVLKCRMEANTLLNPTKVKNEILKCYRSMKAWKHLLDKNWETMNCSYCAKCSSASSTSRREGVNNQREKNSTCVATTWE